MLFFVAERILNLYEEITMDVMHRISQGAAPSVAPTWKKRGPRPHPIGRRGRLPFSLATPRRAISVTLFLYMDMLTTDMDLSVRKTVTWIVLDANLAVDVALCRGRVRAMVRIGGMAMAAAEEEETGAQLRSPPAGHTPGKSCCAAFGARQAQRGRSPCNTANVDWVEDMSGTFGTNLPHVYGIAGSARSVQEATGAETSPHGDAPHLAGLSTATESHHHCEADILNTLGPKSKKVWMLEPPIPQPTVGRTEKGKEGPRDQETSDEENSMRNLALTSPKPIRLRCA